MEIAGVIERVERAADVRAAPSVPVGQIESALADLRGVRAWVDATEAALASSLARQASFPEAAIAAATRGSVGAASKTLDRSRTLDAAPTFADSLERGAVTSGHVDELTRVGVGLEPAQRDELLERCSELIDVAEHATTTQWGRRVRDEARRIAADTEMDRLERQRRATSLRTWVDAEGMWNMRGRFDPLTGVRVATRLDVAVETLFAEQTPVTAPTDPIERQHHLRALALERLLDTPGTGGGKGRHAFVAVIDADGTDTGPRLDWSIPVEVPFRVVAELADNADIHTVVVRNGVVLYAPGQLDLGRTTRLASPAQRRALRGLYRTCAVPGCATHYDRCKLHHVIWWRHGGRTDLDNLLPLCVHHHHKVHDAGWQLTLGPNRELGITFPDGRIMTTGPPNRRAA